MILVRDVINFTLYNTYIIELNLINNNIRFSLN